MIRVCLWREEHGKTLRVFLWRQAYSFKVDEELYAEGFCFANNASVPQPLMKFLEKYSDRISRQIYKAHRDLEQGERLLADQFAWQKSVTKSGNLPFGPLARKATTYGYHACVVMHYGIAFDVVVYSRPLRHMTFPVPSDAQGKADLALM